MSDSKIPGLDAIAPGLEASLRRRLHDMEARLERALACDLSLLLDASVYLFQAGGKRIRPSLVFLAGHLGNPAEEALTEGAAAIELTHLASLYHDDVIDGARLRRGVPAAHEKWGVKTAILTGDFLFARATGLVAALGREASDLIARTVSQLCEGQIREVTSWGDATISEAAYFEIVRRKTASLFGASCRMGGLLSGASRQDQEHLEAYGLALGVAFQLSDDLLDIQGNGTWLGKNSGVDLAGGWYTLPVIHALAHGKWKGELSALLASGPPQGESLRRAREIVGAEESLLGTQSRVRAAVAEAKERAARLSRRQIAPVFAFLADLVAGRCKAAAP
ncbi:MAG: polyprenyl synthetase family protein [Planctomycetes bacterium]|nr:polyprenyl synthetase family protein [Planctomycetota bacterium]